MRRQQNQAPVRTGLWPTKCHICTQTMLCEQWSNGTLRIATKCICYSKAQATTGYDRWIGEMREIGCNLVPLPTVEQYVCWYKLGGFE